MTTAWYADTSALVKLVVDEPESEPMRRWTAGRDLVSCDLLRTEARRATAHDAALAEDVDRLVASTMLIGLTPDLLDAAGRLGGGLRSLDAIHVTAARELGDDLAGIVTYDLRMATAAEELGIRVVSPGEPSERAEAGAGRRSHADRLSW